jgi:hypothetical protein
MAGEARVTISSGLALARGSRRMAWRWVTCRHYLPFGHHDQAITLLGLLHIVGSDKRPSVPADGLANLFPQPGAAERSDPRGGLIEYQELRLVG